MAGKVQQKYGIHDPKRGVVHFFGIIPFWRGLISLEKKEKKKERKNKTLYLHL